MEVKLQDGRTLEGQPVGYTARLEPWGEYELEDGTILRVKLVVTRVFRTEEKGQDGRPVYVFNSSQVTSIE